MSEEQTDRLEGGTPFEIRVLRELANLNNRLTSLQEKVDTRLQETRPIWEAVLSRLDSMEARVENMDARLERVDAKFDIVRSEVLNVRADVDVLKKHPPAA